MRFIKLFFLGLLALAFAFPKPAEAQAADSKRAAEFQRVADYLNNLKAKYTAKGAFSQTEKSGVKADNPLAKAAPAIAAKANGMKDRKSFLMNGNKVQVELTNYGGIGTGYGGIREISDVVWKGLPYVFQFVPIIGASVPDNTNPNKRLHIISDAINDWASWNLIEVNPTKDTLWQFQPLEGYADPDQSSMACNPDFDKNRDGKPDSWPRSWYNETLGKYVWPGYLKQDVNNADLETFFAMDDRDNAEFNYFPYNNDKKKKGIGIQIDGRAFQWNNSLAENAVFFVYTVTNVSDKDVDSLFFGIYGDPDLGGAPDNGDDIGFFIPPYSLPNNNVDNIPVYARSMTYFTDDGNKTGEYGLPLGYLGCKFLESPGNQTDGFDNDGDGMVDESQFDGIDNDHDWNAETDDVGIDGIASTGDEGEGDGKPTSGRLLSGGALDPLHPGEPNFEYTDLDEADQIGLTSFSNWIWKKTGVNDDEDMWRRNKPGSFADFELEGADITFTFGSGYISLKKGESKRISMALLLGDDLNDLLTTATTVQDIYNKNYSFFKPPELPTVTAVPGDKKVTLYWDNKSEGSVDPITGKDFEGYVIYRSTEPDFSDIQTVTDGRGTGFLLEPLKTTNGLDAKWDVGKIDEPFTDKNGNGKYDTGEPFTDYSKDGVWTSNVNDIWKGYHPVAYQGRGLHYYLGDNTGLVHSYADSNNVINGQRYYYAVVAYDHGDSANFPPSETSKKISTNPITGEEVYDKNTCSVVPGPRASGYQEPSINKENLVHLSGIGSGSVQFARMNDLLIKDNEYKLSFSDSVNSGDQKLNFKNYSVFDSKIHTAKLNFFGTKFTDIGNKNIADDSSLKLSGPDGSIYKIDKDFVIDRPAGKIRRSDASSISDNVSVTYELTYHYYPVYQSRSLSDQDDNAVFDGVNVKVTDLSKLEINSDKSGWTKGNSNLTYVIGLSSLGSSSLKEYYPADYEVTFSDKNIDSAMATVPGQPKKRIPVKYSVSNVTAGVPQKIYTFLNEANATRNSAWDPGEEIIFYKPGATGALATDKLTWGLRLNYPPATAKDTIMPASGDVFYVTTNRPFNTLDTFLLKTSAGKVSSEVASGKMDDIYVVPNPYVGYNALEPANKLPGQSRGERRIYFEHLPQKCTIRIFTIAGDPVQTINHESPVDNAREFWNLLNRDGFSVTYGLYIAHIDAPGIGEKIIKFALIK